MKSDKVRSYAGAGPRDGMLTSSDGRAYFRDELAERAVCRGSAASRYNRPTTGSGLFAAHPTISNLWARNFKPRHGPSLHSSRDQRLSRNLCPAKNITISDPSQSPLTGSLRPAALTVQRIARFASFVPSTMTTSKVVTTRSISQSATFAPICERSTSSKNPRRFRLLRKNSYSGGFSFLKLGELRMNSFNSDRARIASALSPSLPSGDSRRKSPVTSAH